MTAGEVNGRRPERVTMHLAPAGARITPPPGRSRWQTYGQGFCEGDVRALYGRDKTKRWERVGWACTRCAVVELEPGLLGTERDEWRRRQDKNRLDVSASYAGQLAVATTAEPPTLIDVIGADLDAIAGVSTPPDPAGVDTRVDVDLAGWDDTRNPSTASVYTEPPAAVLHPATSPGVDTRTTTAGWDPLARVECPSCDKRIAASNLAKHRRRVHGLVPA